MASFNVSANQSCYQKQMIEKAFQNLLEESMRYECPSIMKKFSSSSDLNLSSVRADLFTSMKMSKNAKKWRKELKKKSKIARKINHSEQVNGYQFNLPGVAPKQERHISTSDDRVLKTTQSSSQPVVWKPSLVSGTKGKKRSDIEFVIPEVSNSPPPPVTSKKSKTNKVRTVSGGINEMEPSKAREMEPSRAREMEPSRAREMEPSRAREMEPSRAREMEPSRARVSETKRKLSSQVIEQEGQKQLQKTCKVVLEKYPNGRKIMPVECKKEKLKDISNNKKNYVFDQWIFRIDENDDVFVKGHLSGSPANMFWSTSEIVRRIDNKTLLTASGKLCILEGALMDKALISKGYPINMIKHFSDGFPLQWKNILRNTKQIPKTTTEEKETRRQTIKKEYVEEEDEKEYVEEEEGEEDNEEQQQDDDETEESAEDDLSQNQKLSIIKESPPVKKLQLTGNGCDYLFNIFSHNAQMDSTESDPSMPPVHNVTKKVPVEKNEKQVKEELVKKVASPKNQVRTRYMTRSLANHLKGKSSRSPKSAFPKESQKNIKIIPKDPTSQKQTTTKKIADEFSSPHPLSNTINSISAKSPKKRISNSDKNTLATKTSSPAKSSQVKKSETQKASLNKKQPSHHQKSQKPSVSKKRTSGAGRENLDFTHSKKTVKRGKELGGKMIKDWTKEEVQKLLTAMSSVSKTDARFWSKVARKVGRSAEECTNFYCSCDLSNLDWKHLKKKDEKTEVPNIIKRKNLHIYDISDSYEDDLFESENFLGHTKKIRLNQDCHLDDIFADLSVKTPSMSDQNFHTPMSKFFLTPVSERQTPASTFSDGDIKIDWDNADRCVKEFKKKQKKGAGRLQMPKKLAKLKSEFKPKSLQLGTLVDELNRINNIPKKSNKEDDETEDSDQNIYFSSESED